VLLKKGDLVTNTLVVWMLGVTLLAAHLTILVLQVTHLGLTAEFNLPMMARGVKIFLYSFRIFMISAFVYLPAYPDYAGVAPFSPLGSLGGFLVGFCVLQIAPSSFKVIKLYLAVRR
jgi:hypothetical protein